VSIPKSLFYLSCSLGLLIYALPRLEIGQGWTPATLFAVVWIAMALIIIASHLRAVLRVDEESSSHVQYFQ